MMGEFTGHPTKLILRAVLGRVAPGPKLHVLWTPTLELSRLFLARTLSHWPFDGAHLDREAALLTLPSGDVVEGRKAGPSSELTRPAYSAIWYSKRLIPATLGGQLLQPGLVQELWISPAAMRRFESKWQARINRRCTEPEPAT